MNHIIVGMLAETFIHPGSGQNVGAIDLPVAREAATDYPFIAGSSLKGALKDAAEQRGSNSINKVFGKEPTAESAGNAGDLLVSDARLLLLPVRSLSSAYKWVTCPHLLERLKRDLARGAAESTSFTVPKVGNKEALGQHTNSGKLFLEERSFTVAGGAEEAVAAALRKLIIHEDSRKRLAEQLVIISNDDFNWFAKYGLAVQARNQLKDNKTSNNFWYEETLPPDTLMYTVLAERSGGALANVKELFDGKPYVQVGGNETVGQGWFALSWLNGAA